MKHFNFIIILSLVPILDMRPRTQALAQDKAPELGSMTAQLVHEQTMAVHEMYKEASSKGDGIWLTTTVTLDRLSKCADFVIQKAESILKDNPLTQTDKTIIELDLEILASVKATVGEWQKHAPSRFGAGRFENNLKSLQETWKWHTVRLDKPESVNPTQDAIQTCKVANRHMAWIEAQRLLWQTDHKGKSTIEVLNEPGMLRWALRSMDHSNRVYREAYMLWMLHESAKAKLPNLEQLKESISKARNTEADIKAFEANVQTLQANLESFTKLFKKPETKSDKK